MASVSLDLKNSVSTCIENIVGPEYKKMAYVNNVSKNSFRNCKSQYGVLTGSIEEISGVNKYLTYSESLTIVLTKGYGEEAVTDDMAVQVSYELRENMFLLYNHLIKTKAGLPSRVMNVTGLFIEEPEYLIDEKVTVLRGTINVLYRLTLI